MLDLMCEVPLCAYGAKYLCLYDIYNTYISYMSYILLLLIVPRYSNMEQTLSNWDSSTAQKPSLCHHHHKQVRAAATKQ